MKKLFLKRIILTLLPLLAGIITFVLDHFFDLEEYKVLLGDQLETIIELILNHYLPYLSASYKALYSIYYKIKV